MYHTRKGLVYKHGCTTWSHICNSTTRQDIWKYQIWDIDITMIPASDIKSDQPIWFQGWENLGVEFISIAVCVKGTELCHLIKRVGKISSMICRLHHDPGIWDWKWSAHLIPRVHKHGYRTWSHNSKSITRHDISKYQIFYIHITMISASDIKSDQTIWFPKSINTGKWLNSKTSNSITR